MEIKSGRREAEWTGPENTWDPDPMRATKRNIYLPFDRWRSSEQPPDHCHFYAMDLRTATAVSSLPLCFVKAVLFFYMDKKS